MDQTLSELADRAAAELTESSGVAVCVDALVLFMRETARAIDALRAEVDELKGRTA
jgi:hypothetical protein